MNAYLREYGSGRFHTEENRRRREDNWISLLQQVQEGRGIMGGHYEIPNCATAVPPGKMSNTYGQLHAQIAARIAALPVSTVRAILALDPRYPQPVATAPQTAFGRASHGIGMPAGSSHHAGDEVVRKPGSV
ncbi:MAG: hypothetical protein NTV32_01910 [Gammaproteobacteria bacterium]|nr:hypothetical protein [Gammaproteobacteria bacterium]